MNSASPLALRKGIGTLCIARMLDYANGTLTIGGASATDLADRYGTPLYVYDRAIVERQIDRFLDAFRSSRIQPFFAMKANANLEILGIFRTRGFGCDAVSPGEIFLARRAGFEAEKIWFTSTNVCDDDLRSLRDPSIVINVDSLASVERLVRFRVPNPVSLRINPPVGAGHHPDVVTGGAGAKFGLDGEEIDEARKLLAGRGLEIVGLHAHVGSGVFDVAPLVESASYLTALSEGFPDLRWLNFGGGFAIPYRPGEPDFPMERYAAALSESVGPTLERRGIRAILEPGRYLIAQSGVLLARITSVRKREGLVWIGCNTGFNHLVRPSRYAAYHHVLNASNGDRSWLRENAEPTPQDAVTALLAGNLCETGDVFTRGESGPQPRPLPPLADGDLVAFCDAGAYGFSMTSSYNARLLPAEILVEASGSRVIRERESLDDLTRGMSGAD